MCVSVRTRLSTAGWAETSAVQLHLSAPTVALTATRNHAEELSGAVQDLVAYPVRGRQVVSTPLLPQTAVVVRGNVSNMNSERQLTLPHGSSVELISQCIQYGLLVPSAQRDQESFPSCRDVFPFAVNVDESFQGPMFSKLSFTLCSTVFLPC